MVILLLLSCSCLAHLLLIHHCMLKVIMILFSICFWVELKQSRLNAQWVNVLCAGCVLVFGEPGLCSKNKQMVSVLPSSLAWGLENKAKEQINILEILHAELCIYLDHDRWGWSFLVFINLPPKRYQHFPVADLNSTDSECSGNNQPV